MQIKWIIAVQCQMPHCVKISSHLKLQQGNGIMSLSLKKKISFLWKKGLTRKRDLSFVDSLFRWLQKPELNKEPEDFPKSPTQVQGLQSFSTSFPSRKLVAGLQVKHLGHEQVSIWDTSTCRWRLAYYATTLVPIQFFLMDMTQPCHTANFQYPLTVQHLTVNTAGIFIPTL